MDKNQDIDVDYIDIDKDVDYRQLKRQSHSHDVERILNEYGLNYETEKTFDDLKMHRLLRYDYYVDSLNCLIEFDGEHHYYDIDYFNDTRDAYLKRRVSDNMKSDYALENKINLIRIPYWYDLSQIRVKIDQLIGNKQLYLNETDQKYLDIFVDTLDLKYIVINKIYDDYEDMLKKLLINSKLSYPTFKKYLIVNYDLNYKEIINENNDWYEIYSNLNDEEYEKYKEYQQVNLKINKNNEIKDLNYYIKNQLQHLYENKALNCKYITLNVLYAHFQYINKFTNIDIYTSNISPQLYGRVINNILENKYNFKKCKNTIRLRTLKSRNESFLYIDDLNVDHVKNTTYYKNLNYKE